MKFTLTQPCANCPFRTDVRPYLTKNRAKEIAHAITEQQRTFTCHKTLKLDEEDRQHCGGALILLEKLNQPNQMMRLEERFGCYDRRKLKMDAPVFDTTKQFIKVNNS